MRGYTNKKMINNGIKNVGDLVQAGQFGIVDKLEHFCSSAQISVKKVEKFLVIPDGTVCGKIPEELKVKDFRKFKNPYLERYGEDEWLENVRTI